MNVEYVFNETLQNCPLCKSTSFGWYETALNRGATLHYYICRRCGIIFQSPRMKAEVVEQFYQSKYRAGDIEAEKPAQSVIEQEQNRASHQIDLLTEWLQTSHHILDIGASTGQFLKLAAEKFKCVCAAVEPGDIYRSTLTGMFAAYSSIEELIAAGETRFDLVVMSHVLEHLSEPIKFLQILRQKVLIPEGLLFIEVPNVYGHSSFEPAHLYAFTERALMMTLKAAGFDIVHIKTHSAPKSFGWKNISVLAKTTNRVASLPPRQLVIPRWIQFQRIVGRSGTRHWYGYLYQQLRKKLMKK